MSAQKFDEDLTNSSNVAQSTNEPLHLSRMHVNDIISGICPQKQSEKNESEIEPSFSSFDSALLYVAKILETNYYNDFLQSSCYAKYQVFRNIEDIM